MAKRTRVTLEQVTDINYAHSRLFDMLSEQHHDEDCALRCFQYGCRVLHGCEVCAEVNSRPSGWSTKEVAP